MMSVVLLTDSLAAVAPVNTRHTTCKDTTHNVLHNCKHSMH